MYIYIKIYIFFAVYSPPNLWEPLLSGAPSVMKGSMASVGGGKRSDQGKGSVPGKGSAPFCPADSTAPSPVRATARAKGPPAAAAAAAAEAETCAYITPAKSTDVVATTPSTDDVGKAVARAMFMVTHERLQEEPSNEQLSFNQLLKSLEDISTTNKEQEEQQQQQETPALQQPLPQPMHQKSPYCVMTSPVSDDDVDGDIVMRQVCPPAEGLPKGLPKGIPKGIPKCLNKDISKNVSKGVKGGPRGDPKGLSLTSKVVGLKTDGPAVVVVYHQPQPSPMQIHEYGGEEEPMEVEDDVPSASAPAAPAPAAPMLSVPLLAPARPLAAAALIPTPVGLLPSPAYVSLSFSSCSSCFYFS